MISRFAGSPFPVGSGSWLLKFLSLQLRISTWHVFIYFKSCIKGLYKVKIKSAPVPDKKKPDSATYTIIIHSCKCHLGYSELGWVIVIGMVPGGRGGPTRPNILVHNTACENTMLNICLILIKKGSVPPIFLDQKVSRDFVTVFK